MGNSLVSRHGQHGVTTWATFLLERMCMGCLMLWKEMKIVEQRVEFVRAVEHDEKCFSALCEDFGVGRKSYVLC